MSNVIQEDDSGLFALRKELLNDLLKKKTNQINTSSDEINDANVEKKFPENTLNDQNKKGDDEDDQDLEVLRLNALKAKRKWTNISNENQNKNLPGRFRYNKDSDEEEEDDDQLYNSKYKKQYSNYEEEDINEYEKNLNNNNNNCSDLTNLDKTNLQNNYETYKIECSKRYTPYDVYEPTDNQTPQALSGNTNDLREYLIKKRNKGANNNLEDLNNDEITKNHNYNDNDNFDDLDYSQPITRPIDVTRDEIAYNNQKYRYNNYFRKPDNYYEKDDTFKSSLGKNSKDGGSLSDNRDEDHVEERENSEEENYDSDEDEDSNSNKKLKSIVIVSNNINKAEPVEKLSSSSRHYSYRRSSSYYRRSSTSPSYSRRSRRY